MKHPAMVTKQEPGLMNRRDLLALGAGAAAAGVLPSAQAQAAAWNAGTVTHLIPTASESRFLIKTSFNAPLSAAPWLSVGSKRVRGERTDLAGRFWRFDVTGLEADTSYTLRLLDAAGQPLCDAWPLKTLPAPDAQPRSMRLLAYTCAGGAEGYLGKRSSFLNMAARRRLLARGLALAPDAVIANGDHIYWDQLTWDNKAFARYVKSEVRPRFGGELDLSLPMYHPRNIDIFTRVCDHQIPGLYGTSLRSTPSWFLGDDHDMFENDEYDQGVATLPVEDYGRVGAELTQHMYYPEFLPDRQRPEWLPGGDRRNMPEGSNGCFGTLRYGQLLETLLYDCRRYLDNKGLHARVVPRWVEEWLLQRTRQEQTSHLLHVPSLPFGYTSGKLGDWYPDILDEKAGKMTLGAPKPGWQPGWYDQGQRLIAALAQQKQRAGVIVQGDFHAAAVARMTRSGNVDMPHPVHLIMAGPLGTGDVGFPSSYRKIESSAAHSVTLQEPLPATEKNGFTIIDVTPQKMVFSVYLWRPPEPVEAIDTLQPAVVYEVPRLG